MSTNSDFDTSNSNMEIDIPYERDFFLWISHGSTITDNYYRFETVTRIPKILFYTTHGRFLVANASDIASYIYCDPKMSYENLLRYVPPFEVADSYYLGVRENIVGQVINDTYYSIALPPLLYSVNTYNAEYQPFINIMGLYHFRINEDDKEMRLIEKVMGWHDIEIEMFVNPSKTTFLTYSKIEGFIKDYTTRYNDRFDTFDQSIIPRNEHKINIDLCSLGIFTCRSFLNTYTSQMSNRESSPVDVYVYKNLTDFTRPANFNQITMNDSGCLELLGFEISKEIILDKMAGWKGSLAEIQYQGCAFNVLNFYNVIDDEIARSLAVCIPATGTSIFSFVDYVNHEIIKKHKRILKYLVLRFTIDSLFNFLDECIQYDVLRVSSWIPIKLYKEDISANNKKNLVGHFISLWFEETEKRFHLLDPQAEIYLSSNSEIKYYMQNHSFQFADSIIMSDANPSRQCDNILQGIVSNFINIQETSVHLRPDELLWGGERATNVDDTAIKPISISDNFLKDDKKIMVNEDTYKNKDKQIDVTQGKIILSEKEIDKQINNVLKILLENEQITEIPYEEFSKNIPEDALFNFVKMDNNDTNAIPVNPVLNDTNPVSTNILGGKTQKKQKSYNRKYSKKIKNNNTKKTIKNRHSFKKHKKTYSKK